MATVPSVDQNALSLQEQTQRLIASSSGFIDTFVVPVADDAPMLLPQTIVLSAMLVPASSKQVEWHDVMLPAYPVHRSDLHQVTALVIEGNIPERRFALLVDDLPESLRLRISTLQDMDRSKPSTVYQYVQAEGIAYQIPDLEAIEQQIFQ